MRRILKPAIVAIAIAAALTACSDDDDDDDSAATEPATTSSAAPSGASDAPAAVTITIQNFAFGEPVTVAPGTTITVVNKDGAPHNVAALDESFRSPDLGKDETGTFVAPSEPGSYDFTCTFHPVMKGTLVVSGDAAETTEPATPTIPGGY